MVKLSPVTGHYVNFEVQGDEYRVFFLENGQGRPLLCQHTAGCHNHEWRYLLEDPDITRPATSCRTPREWGSAGMTESNEHVFDELPRLLDGEADRATVSAVSIHLRGCEDCQQELISAVVAHSALSSAVRIAPDFAETFFNFVVKEVIRHHEAIRSSKD